MPARNTKELRKDQIRTTALMHELMHRTGSENPHQFAGWYDRITHSHTQDSGKWRANFAGSRPLSKRQLIELAQIYPDTHSYHQNGPNGLWRALWGEAADLIACVRSHPKSSPQIPFQASEHAVQLSILAALDDQIDFDDFVRVIALYRLRVNTEPSARVDGIGLNLSGCAWRNVETCLNDAKVRADLDRLGIRALITQELAQLEAERIKANPKALIFD
ncbi:TPA: hypothetical protein ACKQDH_003340 [Pseudomonas aeruginosa]